MDTSVFTEIPELDYDEPAPDITTREFEKVVRSRRSVRAFTDEEIPEEVMRRCLDLALLAPNSSNLQPWEFYWVRDQEKKAKLSEYCFNQPATETAQELIVCVARINTWRRNREVMLDHFQKMEAPVANALLEYYKRIVPLAYGHGPFYWFAPIKRLMFFLTGLFRAIPRKPARKADMRVWAHKSTALACENLMLALRAYGYDSCPIEGMDESRVRRLVNLPRGAEVCMIIAAGKRAPNGIYGEQIRFDKSLFVFEV